MPIVSRPANAPATLLGGSIIVPVNACHHGQARSTSPWTAEPGTAGSVAVVGAGKMGLPLAAQFASHGWNVVAVDVQQAVVDAINEGRSHIGEEPGVATLVAEAHERGNLRAMTDGSVAAREADVVVLIVPVMLDAAHRPDYRYMDAAVEAIGPGIHVGSTVIFETTLPVGDTRTRVPPAGGGQRPPGGRGLLRRLLAGAPVLRRGAPQPRDLSKLVGGIGAASTDRAARFYDSVLDAEIVAMSSAEAAEFSSSPTPRTAMSTSPSPTSLQRTPTVSGRHPRGYRRGQQPAYATFTSRASA
jgi:hypothetical protein